MIASIASVAGHVLFLALCPTALLGAERPDDSLVEFLTEDLWQTTVGPEGVVFEITFRDGSFGGRLHRVIDGRQHAELTVTQVVVDGRSIEIQIAPYPPFRGRIDRAVGRIEGGMSEAGPYAAMDLHRASRVDWPMIEILPDAGQGPYRWKRPEKRGDGWATGDLDEAALDQEAVEALVTAIAQGHAGAMHSLLIARGGKLVVEQYFHGWRPDDLHRIASVTKSVSSLLVGVAIDRGLLDGVDAPAHAPVKRSYSWAARVSGSDVGASQA